MRRALLLSPVVLLAALAASCAERDSDRDRGERDRDRDEDDRRRRATGQQPRRGERD